MNKLILFHGTPDKIVVPTYGKGEEKHDYGQGFYLTDSIDPAKEFGYRYSRRITFAWRSWYSILY